MGDNYRRALAYPRLEKGVGVTVKDGATTWFHGHDGSWLRTRPWAATMHGTVIRLVAAARGLGGRPGLVVVAFADEGDERGFAKDDVTMDGGDAS